MKKGNKFFGKSFGKSIAKIRIGFIIPTPVVIIGSLRGKCFRAGLTKAVLLLTFWTVKSVKFWSKLVKITTTFLVKNYPKK
ncbi:MAG: hypothetical protein D8B60_02755 [Moraxella sp.]|nr:MAG: hypothetical protein D8B60_02755 [Moraxella sp.]